MRDAARNRPRTSLELTHDLAGKSSAFCPRAVTALVWPLKVPQATFSQ